MEYKIIFTINGKRELLILEHVKEEYGVSEQEFWCCWIGNQPHFEGDGDTAQEAIENMISKMAKTLRLKEEIEAKIAAKNTGLFI